MCSLELGALVGSERAKLRGAVFGRVAGDVVKDFTERDSGFKGLRGLRVSEGFSGVQWGSVGFRGAGEFFFFDSKYNKCFGESFFIYDEEVSDKIYITFVFGIVSVSVEYACVCPGRRGSGYAVEGIRG